VKSSLLQRSSKVGPQLCHKNHGPLFDCITRMCVCVCVCVCVYVHTVARSNSCKNVVLQGCGKLRGSISYFLATRSSQMNVEASKIQNIS